MFVSTGRGQWKNKDLRNSSFDSFMYAYIIDMSYKLYIYMLISYYNIYIYIYMCVCVDNDIHIVEIDT